MFGQSAPPVAMGLGVGVIASVPLSGLLRSLLFGISATDWLTMSAAVALLGTVAFVAVYFPARRATRVEPLVALRYE